MPAPARARREHVCRDLVRPPLALERVRESSHGQLVSALAHPRSDGARHVVLDPLELLETLGVLVPAPRTSGLREHGVLAPPAAGRALIVPRPSEGADDEGRGGVGRAPAGPTPGASAGGAECPRLGWVALLTRVVAWDVRHCPRGGGRRRMVAGHTRAERLGPLLARLGRAEPTAATGAARAPPAAAGWTDAP